MAVVRVFVRPRLTRSITSHSDIPKLARTGVRDDRTLTGRPRR